MNVPSRDFKVPSRDFKGIWIPANVWLDNRLTYFERCLLSEIHSLDGEKGCFASNEYLCEFFNERERKIQEGIAKLKELGYLYQESFDGRIRVLRTCLNPKNDKSLFNTSEVRNSAPLTCQNPHPSHIIYNKGDSKEQQHDAAAFSNSSHPEQKDHSKPQKIPISKSKPKEEPIHEILEKVHIPLKDKIEITRRYSADAVKNAIEWATSPQTKIKESLVQAIKWACQNKPEVPKNKGDEISANKAYAKKFDGKKKGSITVNVLNDCVEIDYGTPYKLPLIISYGDKAFKEQLESALRKCQVF
jgi:hypothetical protein